MIHVFATLFATVCMAAYLLLIWWSKSHDHHPFWRGYHYIVSLRFIWDSRYINR